MGQPYSSLRYVQKCYIQLDETIYKNEIMLSTVTVCTWIYITCIVITKYYYIKIIGKCVNVRDQGEVKGQVHGKPLIQAKRCPIC